MSTTKTHTTRSKPSQAKLIAKSHRDKAMVKRSNRKANAKATKANGKARKANGGGKALKDFGNDAKLRVLKPKEIPARVGCFKTGQTVSACLAAQKSKGYRGRRKFIRAQIAQGRVSLS